MSNVGAVTLPRAHADIHRQNDQLARSRHGDIEQASPLLERKLQVVVAQANECLGGRTRRADILHELPAATIATCPYP